MSKYIRQHHKYARGTYRNTAILIIVLGTYKYWSNTTYLRHFDLKVDLILCLILAIVLYWIYRRFLKNLSVKRSISTIDQMNGLEFEKLVVKLLRSQGYSNVRLTEKYDYGVDITANKDGVRWGVQVKRNSNLVKAIAVRQVVTALNKYNCDRSMVVTNSVYSNVAKELARSNDCILIDRSKLIEWI